MMNVDNQTVIIPQTYKRYDGKLFCTIGISKPISKGDCINYKGKKITCNQATAGVLKHVNAHYTEALYPHICAWYNPDTNEYYHPRRIANNILIVYRALFDDNDTGLYFESKKKFVRLMEFNNEKECF